MKTLFASCLDPNPNTPNPSPPPNRIDTIHEPPFKYKIASTLKIVDIGVRFYAEPCRKQKYTFSRSNLRFLSTNKLHVPLVYFPMTNPEQSLILVYCHGSGSCLNHVFQFAASLFLKYKIAVVAYDYTGDGESSMKFSSYEEDVKLVLAWVINKGYKLSNTILCGFSLGSYSALAIPGQMARLLISPICGILSFMDGEARRFSGEKYGTVEHALCLQSKSLIIHCSQELVHISHAQLLQEALEKNSIEKTTFFEITDRSFEHRSAPSFLCTHQGQKVMNSFLCSLQKPSAKRQIDQTTQKLRQQLLEIVFYHCDHPCLDHLKEDKQQRRTE